MRESVPFPLPRERLYRRLLAPGFGLFVLSWMLCGMMINRSQVVGVAESRDPASQYETLVRVETPWAQATWVSGWEAVKGLARLPALCGSVPAESEYLRLRCRQVALASALGLGLASLPFWLVAALALVWMGRVAAFYRAANRAIQTAPKSVPAQAVMSAGGRDRDAVAWCLGLRSQRFVLADRRVTRAYVLPASAGESRGQALEERLGAGPFGLFDVGVWWGKRRWVALPQARPLSQ